MSIGLILLIVVTLLVLFGVAQRVLDRLRLTDRQALFVIALMIGGGFIPDIPIGSRFAFNIGGALIPLALCVWLWLKADEAKAISGVQSSLCPSAEVKLCKNRRFCVYKGGTIW